MKRSAITGSVVLVAALVCFYGCSNSTNPLAAFQPEIGNATDNFQFQATGITNVTTTVEYTWQNTGTRVTIALATNFSFPA